MNKKIHRLSICYHSVNVMKNALSQSDHIKLLSLKYNFFNFWGKYQSEFLKMNHMHRLDIAKSIPI